MERRLKPNFGCLVNHRVRDVVAHCIAVRGEQVGSGRGHASADRDTGGVRHPLLTGGGAAWSTGQKVPGGSEDQMVDDVVKAGAATVGGALVVGAVAVGAQA